MLIPTLDYCLAKRGAYSTVGILPGLGGVLIPTLERWNTAWLTRGAYSNVGILPGLGGVLIPTLEYCLA